VKGLISRSFPWPWTLPMSLKHSERGCISWDLLTSSLQAKVTMSLRWTRRNGMPRHGKKSWC
jgi:hypothetical protein